MPRLHEPVERLAQTRLFQGDSKVRVCRDCLIGQPSASLGLWQNYWFPGRRKRQRVHCPCFCIPHRIISASRLTSKPNISFLIRQSHTRRWISIFWRSSLGSPIPVPACASGLLNPGTAGFQKTSSIFLEFLRLIREPLIDFSSFNSTI